MKILYSLILFVMVAFSGCTEQTFSISEQQNQSVTTPSAIPPLIPSSTSSPTVSLSSTKITAAPSATFTANPTKTLTATPYIEAYPLKRVWVEFGSTPDGHADYEFSFPVTIPNWVLYTDGTFIIYHKEIFQTKVLTKSEACNLFTRIKQSGFYQVKTSGENFSEDPIYVNVPPEKLWTDDAYVYLGVNGSTPKILWVYQPISEYTIPLVKRIMSSMANYSPTNLERYQPDRLGLYVMPGRPYSELQDMMSIPWPKNTKRLSENNRGVLYLEGDSAVRIYSLFKKPYTWLVFTDQGQEYSVIARPLLPHERRTNDGIEVERSPKFEPPFACK